MSAIDGRLRAFPDPDRPKAFYLERVRRHREADELIRGLGWDGRRGCAVGCTLDCYDHAFYPVLIGVPEVLGRLEDWLFENLPGGHLEWPERFLGAIPEGADLSGVYPAWSVRLLTRCLDRIGDGGEPWRVACRDAVAGVRRLCAEGTHPESASWSESKSAAKSAAESAAKSAAAESSSWSAAESASWSAVVAARSAAWSAARSAARSAAWSAVASSSSWSAAQSAEIDRQAADLIELLEAAPLIP